MHYRLWADMVVLLHVSFVVFVVLGGVLTLRWPRLAWVHLPAALWGVMIELGGWVCPLTSIESHFRQLGGGSAYGETFIEHYLEPVLYPLGLTRHAQFVFGLTALFINLAVYARLWYRRRTKQPGV